MNIYELRNYILGLPKSVIFNYKAFGIEGIFKMPVLISHKTHFKGIKKR